MALDLVALILIFPTLDRSAEVTCQALTDMTSPVRLVDLQIRSLPPRVDSAICQLRSW